MQHVIDSARAALKAKNWYAALSVAFTLPDVCMACEGIDGHERRFVEFFDRYLKQNYSVTRTDFDKREEMVADLRRAIASAQSFEEQTEILKRSLASTMAGTAPNQYQDQMVTGYDLYGFRCAISHEGTGSIDQSRGRGRRKYSEFMFRAPREGLQIHCNTYEDKLELDVAVICEELCSAAEKWLAEESGKPGFKERLDEIVFTIEP